LYNADTKMKFNHWRLWAIAGRLAPSVAFYATSLSTLSPPRALQITERDTKRFYIRNARRGGQSLTRATICVSDVGFSVGWVYPTHATLSKG